jgi:ADP-ribose pyrophosphatase YjhB (NUDIX family)/Holliday junction resolvase-like predicted endonuclease
MTFQVGVKALLADGMGKFLLLKRAPARYPEVNTELWDIVGGRIDPGIDLSENLNREIVEETGLKIIGVPKLVAAQDVVVTDDRHIVRLTYLAQANGNRVKLSGEHISYRWLALDEISALEGLDKHFKELLPDIKRLTALYGYKVKDSFTSNIPAISEPPKYLQLEDAKEHARIRKKVDEKFVNLELWKSRKNPGNKVKKSDLDAERSPDISPAVLKKIAHSYLKKKGFELVEISILEDIDVVAQKNEIWHFIQIHRVTREKGNDFSREASSCPHLKHKKEIKENIKRFLAQHKAANEPWELDALELSVNIKDKKAHCRLVKDIVL